MKQKTASTDESEEDEKVLPPVSTSSTTSGTSLSSNDDINEVREPTHFDFYPRLGYLVHQPEGLKARAFMVTQGGGESTILSEDELTTDDPPT